MQAYFARLQEAYAAALSLARRARRMGLDPETDVEIAAAEDLAARVENQVGFPGVAGQIRRLRAGGTVEWEEVAVKLVKELLSGLKRDTPNLDNRLYQAVRTGLSILTEGVLVAPKDGLIGVRIGKNTDGTGYISLWYAGPIRAAGGTAQAMSVLLGDVARRVVGLGRYIPTDKEVERYKEEIPLYKQAQHLQSVPPPEDIETVVRNCPVCIDGEGTERGVEVAGARDLPRVSTNTVRGGACLVIAEGICMKASKLKKRVEALGLVDGWEFLGKLEKKVKSESERVDLPEEGENDGKEDDSGDAGHEHEPEEPVSPAHESSSSTLPSYLKDTIAGRPVFCHPNRKGGFRLRYGRGRTTGLAALAIHPAAMILTDGFLAIGTQMKIERPGKGCVATPCDSIDGPIVLLRSGDLVGVNDMPSAEAVKGEVAEFVDLGEILVPFGEFLQNNKQLAPGAYSADWWGLELLRALGGDGKSAVYRKFSATAPGPAEAFGLSERYSIPLHPSYNLFWHDLDAKRLAALREWVLGFGRVEDGRLVLPVEKEGKRLLEDLGALHTVSGAVLRIDEKYTLPLVRCLGLEDSGGKLVPRTGAKMPPDGNPLDIVSGWAGVTIRPRGPTRIGARMGRPEKARERKMNTSPHFLFPLGEAGGKQRLVMKAAEQDSIKVEAGLRACPSCGTRSPFASCQKCGAHTDSPRICSTQTLDISGIIRRAAGRLGVQVPSGLKGVIGLSSVYKTPEAVEKGILRALHGVWVFRDGTVRFDLTDAPLTHFRPREIGISVERCRALGYGADITGNPLSSGEQVVELRPQDIVVSESCGDYLLKAARFIDALLEKHYGLEPFYRAGSRDDLVGHAIIGLSPHTSTGVLGRVIGYTKGQVCYAHPFFHAAKRRNADGDEDCVMLLMDGLLNYSKQYLSDRRGGDMDAPQVLSLRLDPGEVDKEARDVDVGASYPLEFFEAAAHEAAPKDVEKLMDTVSRRRGALRYEGFGFTHDTAGIATGPEKSAYTTIPDMHSKLDAQMALCRKIRAVDFPDVVDKVILAHFMPDMQGNLRKFCGQMVMCTKCYLTYRRVPLSGRCRCGGNLKLTVPAAGVRKYLEITKRLVREHPVPDYTRRRLELIERYMEETLGKVEVEVEEEPSLDRYM